MSPWDGAEKALTDHAAAIVASGGAVAAVYRGFLWAKTWIKRRRQRGLEAEAREAEHDRKLDEALEVSRQNAQHLSAIRSELSPNGGSSLKDQVTKIAMRMDISDQIRRVLADGRELALFETDASGSCVWVNGTYSRLVGMPPAAFQGFGWVNAIHPDDRERISEEWEFAVDQQREFRGLVRLFDAADVVHAMHCSATPLRSNGKLVGYFGQMEPYEA